MIRVKDFFVSIKNVFKNQNLNKRYGSCHYVKLFFFLLFFVISVYFV